MTIEILFEDNHLLCLNKPAGIPTQPPPEGGISLETMAKEFIKTRDHKPGNVYLHAVHRLDKLSSGIVVFAKTQKALSRMQEAFREKEVIKQYYALVEGAPPEKEGFIELFLTHVSHKTVVGYTPEAKKSRLTYRIIEQKKEGTLIEVTLETGRYHQIRASFAHIGCPVFGDIKYGSNRPFVPNAIALQHHRITFVHPTKKESLTLSLELSFE